VGILAAYTILSPFVVKSVQVAPVRYNGHMPAKYTVKMYVENGYYHLLNRGVDKRSIFFDKKDSVTFLSLLKRYLTNPDLLPPELQFLRPSRRSHLYEQITLVAYCLMPNHFHLLVRQKSRNAITEFARCLMNSYVRHFNDRHERVGPLFQGRIKGILVDNDSYLLHLTRYIHRNPEEFWERSLRDYPYSSYAEYLGLRSTSWIHPEAILAYFRSPLNKSLHDYFSYESFVEESKDDSSEILKEITLE